MTNPTLTAEEAVERLKLLAGDCLCSVKAGHGPAYQKDYDALTLAITRLTQPSNEGLIAAATEALRWLSGREERAQSIYETHNEMVEALSAAILSAEGGV